MTDTQADRLQADLQRLQDFKGTPGGGSHDAWPLLELSLERLSAAIDRTIAERDRLRQQNAELRWALDNILAIWQRCHDDGIDLSYMDEPIATVTAPLARTEA